MEHPKGVIGIARAFLGRYTEFDLALEEVHAPIGSWKTTFKGVAIPHNYNNMVREMLRNEELKWVWFLGDDHVFPQDLLLNLLDRDVDIVVPLCLRRIAPFEPVISSSARTKYQPQSWDVINGQTGLVEMTKYTFGNAGMLVRRKVFETIPEPWFMNGKTDPEMNGCDLYFCELARRKGFKIYLDLDNPIGHITHVAVWPSKDKNNNYSPDLRMA